jgi:hypothetical protein
MTDIKGENSDLIENQCILPLTKKFPGIKFRIFPERKTALKYYSFICFSIRIKDGNGNPYDIVDGGFTNWTQEILSNRKERLLTSGMGTELLSKILSEKK